MRPYSYDPSVNFYFVTSTVLNWINVFTRKLYKDIVIEDLNYYRNHRPLNIHGYCLMSNHIHLIVSSDEPEAIGETVRDFKRHSAHQIRGLLSKKEESRPWIIKMMERAGRSNRGNGNFQFWNYGNHPIYIDNQEKLIQRLDYTHQNPVKAGWVMEPEEYAYSSARNYAGLPAVMEIQMLDLGVN